MSLDHRQLKVLDLMSGSGYGKVLQYLLQRDNAIPLTQQNYREIANRLHGHANDKDDWELEKIHQAIFFTQPENAHLWVEATYQYLDQNVLYNEKFWVYSLKGIFKAAGLMDKEGQNLPCQQKLPEMLARLLSGRPSKHGRSLEVKRVEDNSWNRLTEIIKDFFFQPANHDFMDQRQRQAWSILRFVGDNATPGDVGPLSLHLFQKLLHMFLARSPTIILLEAASGISCNELAVK